jgi:hypothetical protein
MGPSKAPFFCDSIKMSKILFIGAIAIFLAACDQSKVKIEYSQVDGLCRADSEALVAHYSITQARAGSDTSAVQNYSLQRYAGEVMYSYPDIHISQRWNLTSHGGLQKFRYFDEDKRAIEYDTTAPLANAEQLWQEKYQIVSDQELEQMSIKQALNLECTTITVYEQRADKYLRHVYWSQDLQLPVKIFQRKGLEEETWLLTRLETQAEKALENFALRERYLSTDFADIGDQETDPFFRKMINLGFIEHGASGFYDTEGNDIGEHHHH